MDRRADVVVVGAGFAGLTAARQIRAAGASVLVMEARDRVGGRTLNADIGEGRIVEMGGQWIGPTQDRVAKLAAELGVDTFPTYHEGSHLMQLEDGELRRYSEPFPPLEEGPQRVFDAALAELGGLAETVVLERPWDTPDAERLDGLTLESWLRDRVAVGSARDLLRHSAEAMATAPATELSLLDTLFHVGAAGGFDAMLNVAGGAQQDRFIGGSQLIPLKIAEELGEAVALGSPVRAIERRSRGALVRSDEFGVEADRVIVAVAPMLAGRIAYDPPLSPQRDGLTQRMPHGSVIKVNVVYEAPFWREEGLSGEAFVPGAPVSYVLDNSPPEGSPGVLVGLIEAERARHLGRESPEARQQTVLDSLAGSFGPRAARPERYLELDWSTEEWTRGCYAAHMVPGTWTAFGPALREPCDLIHWAGTETALHWAGYLDGAVGSGERAATEVLEALGS